MTRKVAMRMLLIDSTMISLDNDHLHSISKICAVLGSMRNHDPHNGNGPDHHSATILGTNCIVDDCVEGAREGVKKSLEQTIRLSRKNMRKPREETFYLLHLSCSSDRACVVNDNQKTYQDAIMYLCGVLKKNKGDFYNNKTSQSDRTG